MGIKRLLQYSIEPEKFLLNKDQAIILFTKKDSTCECIYIDSTKKPDFNLLRKVTNIDTVKFIGGAETLSRIKELNLFSFEREVIVSKEIEAVFLS